MFITKLTAENFKRLVAVEVEFDASGGVTTISGPNGAGKTSIIDALASVIAGGKAPKIPNPIRKGEDNAVVIAETDDGLIITRRWKRRDDDSITGSLEITNAAGMTRKSPQALLDTFLKGFALDPLKFAQAKPADQVATLLDVIPDLPFVPSELDVEYGDTFETRTTVNRQAKELAAQLAGIPLDKDAPETEQQASELLAQLDTLASQTANRALLERHVTEYTDRIADVENQMGELNARLAQFRAGLDTTRAQLADAPAVDEGAEAALREQIAGIDAVNARVRSNARRADIAAQLAAKEARADELTEELEGIKQRRADGLAAATLPLPGLGFGDDGVTLDGVPFSQASGAEQLVAAIAIAAAANPGMRLVLVRDATLLDGKNRGVIEAYAAEKNLRIILEVVDEHAESGIVIAEGEVQGA